MERSSSMLHCVYFMHLVKVFPQLMSLVSCIWLLLRSSQATDIYLHTWFTFRNLNSSIGGCLFTTDSLIISTSDWKQGQIGFFTVDIDYYSDCIELTYNCFHVGYGDPCGSEHVTVLCQSPCTGLFEEMNIRRDPRNWQRHTWLKSKWLAHQTEPTLVSMDTML